MIANPPPIAIRVNGRQVGALGVRWRGAESKKPNPSVSAMNKVLHRYGLQSLRYKGDIRQLYQQVGRIARARGVPRRSLRRNPSGRRRGEVEIYADIERIYATKGRRSAAAGEHFVHNFRHAAAFGRPDGTVILRGRGGRRLWDHFRA